MIQNNVCLTLKSEMLIFIVPMMPESDIIVMRAAATYDIEFPCIPCVLSAKISSLSIIISCFISFICAMRATFISSCPIFICFILSFTSSCANLIRSICTAWACFYCCICSACIRFISCRRSIIVIITSRFGSSSLIEDAAVNALTEGSDEGVCGTERDPCNSFFISTASWAFRDGLLILFDIFTTLYGCPASLSCLFTDRVRSAPM